MGIFFNKVAGLRLATLFRKRFRHRCFLRIWDIVSSIQDEPFQGCSQMGGEGAKRSCN